MAYATFDELASSYGEERVRRIFAKTTTEALEPYVQRKLEAAAGYMDTMLSKVYSTPIDVTLPDPADGDYNRMLRLSSMLSELNIIFCLFHLTTGASDLRDSLKEHHDRAMSFMEKLMTGEVALPGVAQSRRIFSVVGPDGQDSSADDPLMPRNTFILHRTLEDF